MRDSEGKLTGEKSQWHLGKLKGPPGSGDREPQKVSEPKMNVESHAGREGGEEQICLKVKMWDHWGHQGTEYREEREGQTIVNSCT